MPASRIGKVAAESSNISSRLQQVTFNSIRKVLPDRLITQACCDVEYTHRERKLTPIITILHMILAAIWPEESFQASWHLAWGNAVGVFPSLQGNSPSSGSLAKARSRLPLALWSRVWQSLAVRAQELSEPFACWRGHRVVLVDGTCVSMSDTPDLHAHFGTNTGNNVLGHYPLARMVTLALANTLSVITYAVGRYDKSENELLRSLLGDLRCCDLLVADRHFAGANLYAEYVAAGAHFLTRVHHRQNISRLRPLEGYGHNDFVTNLAVSRVHQLKDPTLPKAVQVRLIKATLRIRGQRTVTWFVTSLLDEATYPASEIIELYARRWRIETLFLQLKVNLSADVLRSKTPDNVLKELAARMTALNVVRMIMLEAAAKHGQDPGLLSFVHGLRMILAFAPSLAMAPMRQLPAIYEAMLFEIAACRVRQRPERLEPRAVRRENKHYPRLRCTRAEWKRQLAA